MNTDRLNVSLNSSLVLIISVFICVHLWLPLPVFVCGARCREHHNDIELATNEHDVGATKLNEPQMNTDEHRSAQCEPQLQLGFDNICVHLCSSVVASSGVRLRLQFQ
jgi:hypothetical protein